MGRILFLPVAMVLLTWTACNDDLVQSGPFEYPIDLQTGLSGHGVYLEWSKTTVSTFTEYIIVRSLDSIPDTPEPVLDGQAVIVERLDKIDETSYVDYDYPIGETHYYKIYANIGERFLMSATRRVDVELQLIPFRMDVMEVDHEREEIVAYDRSSRVLYVYDYVEGKLLSQVTTSMTNPILRIGEYNGKDEIYLCDRNSTIEIRDRATLLRDEFLWLSSSSVRDFIYDKGIFAVTTDNSTQNVQVYSRSSLNIMDGMTGVTTSFRYLVKAPGLSPMTFYEVSHVDRGKYTVIGNDLQRVLTATDVSSSILIPAVHPERNEMIFTTSGTIFDENLERLDVLGEGVQFYNVIGYSGDGRYVGGSRFEINSSVIDIFDSEESYARISTIPVNFNPAFIFGAGNDIYAAGAVFIGGLTQSVLIRISLP